MPALDHLASLFFAKMQELGSFEEVQPESMPPVYRDLLAHHDHMTVAMERQHGCQVGVEVLQTLQDGDFYARKIVLHRQSDNKPVLFGVPRINLRLVDDQVRKEILSKLTPLGRVLIEHNVMREVQLASLYRVEPGPELCRLLNLSPQQTTFGRTAFIYCDGYPCIELLEIVAPV